MPTTDWYRNAEWSESIAEAFFGKLRRARSQRDQYLVIQALTLTKSHPEITLTLTDHYFETRSRQSNDPRARVARGDAYSTLGQYEDAVAEYELALSAVQEGTKHGRHYSSWGAEGALLFLIADQALEQHYERGLELCTEEAPDIAFPLGRFRYYGPKALLLAAAGKKDEARKCASLAIEAASARQSEFQYHRDVGTVGTEYDSILRRIRRLDA